MLTRQEMFNRAVIGLRSQGWARSSPPGSLTCQYEAENGNRCAWGWVDVSLKWYDEGSVRHLRAIGRGIAAELDLSDLGFANDLQETHDTSYVCAGMEASFRLLGERYGLSWPE